jgi:hypothetical protein
METAYDKLKVDTSALKAEGLLARWAWWIIWSLTFLLPVSKKHESLTRWGWGIACAALGICCLWYTIQCAVEATISTSGGYVSYEDWGEWVGPARYQRHKSGEALLGMMIVGLCAGAAYALLMLPDPWDAWKWRRYFIRCHTEAHECAGMLGSTSDCSYDGSYLDAGWKRIERKTARALAKQPPGRYLYTVGGPDRFCSQRDYLSLIRNQKHQWDVVVGTEPKCTLWAGTEGRVRT